MFKERIIVANEKKDRALSRRLKYENDMKEKDDQISELKQKNSAMHLESELKIKEMQHYIRDKQLKDKVETTLNEAQVL